MCTDRVSVVKGADACIGYDILRKREEYDEVRERNWAPQN